MRDNAGRTLDVSSACACAMRVFPSASATRILRDVSTSTGTTMSPALTGGRSSTGLQTNSSTATSASARSVTSRPRCTLVERNEGTPVRVDGEPDEPDRDDPDEPPGERRREVDQGRFLVASALK